MSNHCLWVTFVFFPCLIFTTDISLRVKTVVAEGTKTGDEKEAIKRLLERTDRNVRPVNNRSAPVNVTFDITFHGIIEMDEKHQILSSSVWVRQDEKHQILTTDIWVRQEWFNEFLIWKPEDCGGLKQIVVDSSLVWLPDIVLYNNVFEEFDGRMDNVQTRVRVRHDGHCWWAAPFVFKTSCHIDVSDFPFDEQRCKLKFGSWQYDESELDLRRNSDQAALAKERVENGEWNVTAIEIKRNVEFYSCCPDQPYPDITFIIKLTRRSLFYTFNLIIPNFLIALLAFYSFCIPVECGERISFVITVLLSMTVFLLLVAESIPPTSEAVPVIGMYYTSSIIEVALALVATGISLQVYYSYLYGQGLSPRVRRFLFHRLGPMLCFDTATIGASYHYKGKGCSPFSLLKKIKKRRTSDGNEISMYNVSVCKSNASEVLDKNVDKTGVKLLSFDCNSKTSGTGSVIGLTSDSAEDVSEQDHVRHRSMRDSLNSELKTISSAVKDQKDSEKQATESRMAAAIVDRAFMVVFCIVFLCSTIAILSLPWVRNKSRNL